MINIIYILLICLFCYFLYNSRENFADVSTISDIDSIKTLALLARDLQSNNGIKVPGPIQAMNTLNVADTTTTGKLNVTDATNLNTLNVKNGSVLETGSVLGAGINKWNMIVPNDDRKSLFFVPATTNGNDWAWENMTRFTNDGDIILNNRLGQSEGISIKIRLNELQTEVNALKADMNKYKAAITITSANVPVINSNVLRFQDGNKLFSAGVLHFLRNDNQGGHLAAGNVFGSWAGWPGATDSKIT